MKTNKNTAVAEIKQTLSIMAGAEVLRWSFRYGIHNARGMDNPRAGSRRAFDGIQPAVYKRFEEG